MTKELLCTMIGKKVTCRIRGTQILDARIQKEGDHLYICQDFKKGEQCEDKLGYTNSWRITNARTGELDFSNPGIDVTDLNFVYEESKQLPIFN